jgi:hypothetical protein
MVTGYFTQNPASLFLSGEIWFFLGLDPLSQEATSRARISRNRPPAAS